MTILTSNSFSKRSLLSDQISRIIRQIGHQVQRLIARYSLYREQKEACATLNAFSDRELRDIGIDRSEIEAAVTGQLRNTTSKPLVDRSSEF